MSYIIYVYTNGKSGVVTVKRRPAIAGAKQLFSIQKRVRQLTLVKRCQVCLPTIDNSAMLYVLKRIEFVFIKDNKYIKI